MMKRRSLPLSKKILLKIYKNYSSLILNDAKVQVSTNQEHLVLILDSRLDFIEHIDNKVNKWNKCIGMIKRYSLALSRKILLTILKKTTPPLMLNDTKMQFATSKKYLVLILDLRLEFIQPIDNLLTSTTKL